MINDTCQKTFLKLCDTLSWHCHGHNLGFTPFGASTLFPALAKIYRIGVSQSTAPVLRRHRPVHSTVVKVHEHRAARSSRPRRWFIYPGFDKSSCVFRAAARCASGAAPKRAHTPSLLLAMIFVGRTVFQTISHSNLPTWFQHFIKVGEVDFGAGTLSWQGSRTLGRGSSGRR